MQDQSGKFCRRVILASRTGSEPSSRREFCRFGNQRQECPSLVDVGLRGAKSLQTDEHYFFGKEWRRRCARRGLWDPHRHRKKRHELLVKWQASLSKGCLVSDVRLLWRQADLRDILEGLATLQSRQPQSF